MIPQQHYRYPALSVFRDALPGFAAAGVFSFFVNLGALVSPIYMQQIFDRVMQSRHLETLLYMTVIVFALLGIFALLDAVRGMILARIARWWDNVVHADLLSAVVRSGVADQANKSSVFQDLMTIRQFVGGPGILPFFDGPWMPLFLGAIFLIHPWLGFIGIFAALGLFILAVLNDFVTRRKMSGLGERQARAQATVELATRHAETVYSMGMLSGVLKRFDDDNKFVADSMYKIAATSARISAFSRFLRYSAQIGVLGTGAYLATMAEITPGSMIAASIILGRALSPAEQAIGAWRGFVGSKNAHRRITGIFKTVTAEQEKTVQPSVKGAVQLQEVYYSLPGQERALLRGLSARFPTGQVTALVGPSGCGKSTLCKLLVGAKQPNFGSVRLDGVSMKNWNREQIGQSVGYLPQTVQLLDGTVKENIARLGEADDKEVVRAAMLAGCHEMINSLPLGYDTVIGENGLHLSGGQAQRIGFARAIYKTPRLIVLDEPNSNLDAEGDAAFQSGIQALKKLRCTIFIVSHKTSALTAVDRILTIRDGGIADDKPREDYLREIMRPVGALIQKVRAGKGTEEDTTKATSETADFGNKAVGAR